MKKSNLAFGLVDWLRYIFNCQAFLQWFEAQREQPDIRCKDEVSTNCVTDEKDEKLIL